MAVSEKSEIFGTTTTTTGDMVALFSFLHFAGLSNCSIPDQVAHIDIFLPFDAY